MSGHSKWSTIKRKKGVLDQKRGKLFSSIGKEITISARLFGGDLEANARLRQAVKKAKSINMPSGNIDKAIKKGTGSLDNVSYEEAAYEGYGPNGIAVFIEAITDNKNRTVAEIRHVLSKAGGSLGQSGSVAWNFNRMGIILIDESIISEDDIFNISIENDAKDFKVEDGYYKLFFDHSVLYEKIEIIEKIPLEIDSSFIAFIPKDFIKISEEESLKVESLIDTLDDLEDVQNVYSNYEVEQAA
ncbi:MAG: YebC/PmpR family DNA-binding transcriptional regulator [Candidatus Marinimicrobia bacterium]|jgi:YebC/PmpR family DNA-binding regulatory protein|nr:YebC/PmpR family DNA-binding transcriptional regulator [Candidatus Neomarinimicrobiota bacterium]MBT3728019.1 YebC/PmpR family DNA-binding transcriptional regulator [Candidatus Neomarinimicrobiota bacterium]MBT3944233.1 YebC/PmpR family DNA-binding transcriptional regulator [Candidatus Neomarinimicrobiota bacterium]MBT4111692.1 YebC/PmpR family DNA-binding transcriptional regulator [Candidatus Neomarinimicrobiota bacterium]MBT4317416.1 YebC/PmpR family DNA-binding transcriptional regulator [